MATASAILDDLRSKWGDTAKDFLSDSISLEWLDQAQKQLSAELRPLKRIKGFLVSANQDYFAVPDDVIMVEVATTNKGLRRVLRRVTPGEYRQQQIAVDNAVGDPVFWTEIEERIYVWPRFSGASKTTTVNASTTAAATTVTMASTGNLRSNGQIIVDSEEMEYTGKTSTTITGVTRGVGGTTSATHVSAAAVTQLDFELIYQRHPKTLASQTDELEIKEIWHKPLLQNYVMYLAYMAEGSTEKANAQYQIWSQGIAQAKEISRRRHVAGPLLVRDFESQRVSGLYGPSV